MLILESLLERQVATGTPSEIIDAGSTNFWEFILPRGHWCWQASFWSPLSNLRAPGTYSPTSRLAQTLGNPGPTASHTVSPALPTSNPVPAPEPSGPQSKPCWDPALPTSGLAAPFKAGPGSQPGQGSVLPTSAHTVVRPTTTELPTQAT